MTVQKIVLHDIKLVFLTGYVFGSSFESSEERDRDTERDRDRQSQRDRDRQTGRDRDRQTDRQTETERQRKTVRQTENIVRWRKRKQRTLQQIKT